MEDGSSLPINTPRNQIILGAPTEKKRDNLRLLGKVTITPFKDLKVIAEYTFNRKSAETTKYDNKFEYANGISNFNKESSIANSNTSIYNRLLLNIL